MLCDRSGLLDPPNGGLHRPRRNGIRLGRDGQTLATRLEDPLAPAQNVLFSALGWGASPGVHGTRLTAKERILLYLLEVRPLDTTVEVPRELAQEGVAQGSRVDLRHLPQNLRPLIQEGLVRERQAHVRGVRQRRKVYALTEAGALRAVRLRERAEQETIQVRDADGIQTVRAADLLGRCHGKVRLAELSARSSEGRTVELADLLPQPPPSSPGTMEEPGLGAFVEMLREAPVVGDFVGRERELALITDKEGPPVVFVQGIAGMGKSWLAAQACERLRGTRNLFWHRVRPWDTRKSVLAHLAEFLAALGQPELRSILPRGEPEQALEVLRDDLPGARAFLVFDDAQEAGPEVLQLLAFLKETLGGARGVRALICSRRALRGFGQKDVLQGSVREIALEGLRRDEVLRFLKAHEAPAEVLLLAGKMGGHPLSVRLLQSAQEAGALGASRRSLHALLEEEIGRDLSDAERTLMQVASLYRVPVPSAALYAEPTLTYDVVRSLADRSLLRPVGSSDWEAHDSIRAFFAELLSPTERVDLGGFAARELATLARTALADGRADAAVNALSNALVVAPSEAERIELWEALGDAHAAAADLTAALMAYGEVTRKAADAERVGRAYRKRGLLYLWWERYPAAARELDAAEGVLGDRRGTERGWIEYGRADILFNQEPFDVEGAALRAEAAVREFRGLTDSAALARALCLRGRIASFQSPDRRALAEACLEESLSLAEGIRDRRAAAEATNGFLELYAYVAPDPDRARHYLALAQRSPPAMADPWVGPYLLWYEAMVALQLEADGETAERAYIEMGRMCRKASDASGGIAAIGGRASVLYFRGRLEEARRVFDEAWQESRARDWLNFLPAAAWLWLSGLCRLRSGDLAGFHGTAAVARAPDFAGRLKPKIFFGQLLDGLDRWISGDRAAEASLAAMASAAEEILRRREVPYFYSAAFVPLVYGCILRASGSDVAADAQGRIAQDALRAFHLRARLAALPEEERQLTATFRRVLERDAPQART